VPNLVGIHDPTAPADDLARDLMKMMAAVDYAAFPFTKRTQVDPPLACGNVLTGVENNLSQPVIDDRRGLWLMLDGELLGTRELAREIERAGVSVEGKDDAGLALAAFVAFGPQFYERLNGQWNLVLHDRERRETQLITDRIGSRILYYAEDGRRMIFASEAKGVVAGRSVATRPGGTALVQLLMAGTHCGDSTWLEGIKVMSPGTHLRLGAGPNQKRRTRYWRFHFREGDPETSEDAYAEGFARRLRAATERCMKRRTETHPIAITLSGGLDSRSVALSIDRSHLPISSITYGSPDSPDAIYAAELAQVIGLDHHFIEDLWPGLVESSNVVCNELLGPAPSGKRGFYSSQLERALWRSEAMGALNGVASTIWHPLYRKYMRLMLNGACGDAMTGSHLTPNLLLSPPRAEVIRDLYRRTLFGDRARIEKLLNPAFATRAFGELQPYFASTFDEIDQDEAMSISNVWDMENRQRRGTFSAFAIERYFCVCRSPYLDYELTEFLATVPGRWRFQQRIYKRMLVTAFPEAKHVPWAYTRGRITKSPAFEFLRESFNFAKGRAERLLPAGDAKAPHWNFRDEAKMMQEDRELAVMLQNFTRSDLFPSEVFDAPGIRAFVDDFSASTNPGELSTLYAHLVGIAKCTELFLSPGALVPPDAADPSRFGVSTEA
jgi:hypothetical protein